MNDLADRVHAVASEVAGPAAASVDAEARFPSEAVAAMREAKLLSAMVPSTAGGGGAGLAEIANAVRVLAEHCASSALVFAMHQIEVAYLVRHGRTRALSSLLAEVVDSQLLLANANSEVGVGGDAGQSVCALERQGGRYRLEKQALAVSYGDYADAILATARTSAESASTDQVLVAWRAANAKLEPTSGWDTMGLRGTCSRGFHIVAEDDEGLVFPEPFSVIIARTGAPVTQVLLGSVWWGLAEAAARRAHAYVRGQLRQNPGTQPRSALRLAELYARLQPLRDLISSAASRFDAIAQTEEVEDWSFGIRLRNVKVESSRRAVDVATRALGICGMAGFSRQSPYSLDRILRDVHGGPIMIGNDRFLEMNSEVLLAVKEP